MSGPATDPRHSVATPLVPPQRPDLTGHRDTALSLDLSDLRPLFPAMKELFLTHTAEAIGLHHRFEREYPAGKNYYMPAIIGEYEAVKVIRSRPLNIPKGLERSQSTILITDRETGLHLHTISGTEVTPVKTALTTMVALGKWIEAAQPEKLEVGIIAAGAVSRAHIAAIYQLFGDRVGTVRVHSTGGSAARLVDEISLRYPCELASRGDLLSQSNVIISATTTAADKPAVTYPELNCHNRPVFVAGIGFNDISRDMFPLADRIVSEDPYSYAKSQFYLAQFVAQRSDKVLFGLSEVVANEVALPNFGVTLFMPYGTAMTDLALCLQSLGINPGTPAQSARQF